MVAELQLFESPDVTPSGFCLWVLDEERSLQKKGYTRRTARSHFGCSCPQKET
jgi:hypothetical protein